MTRTVTIPVRHLDGCAVQGCIGPDLPPCTCGASAAMTERLMLARELYARLYQSPEAGYSQWDGDRSGKYGGTYQADWLRVAEYVEGLMDSNAVKVLEAAGMGARFAPTPVPVERTKVAKGCGEPRRRCDHD